MSTLFTEHEHITMAPFIFHESETLKYIFFWISSFLLTKIVWLLYRRHADESKAENCEKEKLTEEEL